MSIEKIDIINFLEKSKSMPVLDVRSPGEFTQAHIPNAFSVPLFSDEERKIIGTAYIQESREVAVNHGLNYFSERMKVIPGEVSNILEKFAQENPASKNGMLIHCWRGGMRSDSVAWLLNLYGYKIFLLQGGYKSFRRWVLQQFDKPYSLKVLAGFTGAGKTDILKELKNKGERVIDLEGLANHRGSAFGALGQDAQPSTEMFENTLAIALWKFAQEQNDNAMWLEDESVHIGTVGIPKPFWQQMRSSPLYFLQIPFDERLKNIESYYGNYPVDELIECTLKIQKRLGGLNTKNAISYLNNGHVAAAFSILLQYYDKMYEASLSQRDNIQSFLHVIKCEKVELKNADVLADIQ
jgi:tRNA 2-selenouridine synthase